MGVCRQATLKINPKLLRKGIDAWVNEHGEVIMLQASKVERFGRRIQRSHKSGED
jgi:hypothetical protein